MRLPLLTEGSRTLLLVGNWKWEVYEAALAAGFRACGWDVIPFDTREYASTGALGRAEAAMRVGPGIDRLNRALLERAQVVRPDAIFLNRCDTVRVSSLRMMKTLIPETVVLVYHNDNPFARASDAFKYRHYLASLRAADVTLVYRPLDFGEAKRRGSRRIELLPPYYLSYLHRPEEKHLACEYRFDVVYAGHYEDDGRDRLIDAIARTGARVHVCGAGWERIRRKYSWAKDMDLRPRFGQDYVATLTSARIGLGLMSGRNRDVYTRRCFEIPACGALLMAPKTPELADYFVENREAVFFESPDGLVASVERLLTDEPARKRIADAGYMRCTTAGNDEVARARHVTEVIESIAPRDIG